MTPGERIPSMITPKDNHSITGSPLMCLEFIIIQTIIWGVALCVLYHFLEVLFVMPLFSYVRRLFFLTPPLYYVMRLFAWPKAAPVRPLPDHTGHHGWQKKILARQCRRAQTRHMADALRQDAEPSGFMPCQTDLPIIYGLPNSPAARHADGHSSSGQSAAPQSRKDTPCRRQQNIQRPL